MGGEAISMADILSALDAIDPNKLDRDDWVKIYTAAQDAQVPRPYIDGWNGRYEGVDQRKDDSVLRTAHKPATPEIAAKTILKEAYARGWDGGKSTAGRPATKGNEELVLGQIISSGDGPAPEKSPEDVPPVLDAERLDMCAIDMLPEDMEPVEMMRRQLACMFRPTEKVNVVPDSFWNDKKKKFEPISHYDPESGRRRWIVLDVGLLAGGKNPSTFLGHANPKAGAWIRFNPTTGGADADVTRYASALVESDDIPQDEQLDLMRRLHLPCRCVVSSGGKSVHAVVRIDAEDKAEYEARVKWLLEFCDKNGLPSDHANKSVSHLMRLAGAKRGDNVQRLLCEEMGPQSWGEFRAWVAEQATQEPEEEPEEPGTKLNIQRACDMTGINTPPKTPELIHSILRRGHKLIVFGPSKASKTWLLIGCGVVLATGRKWLGRFRCERSRVLLVNTEMDAASFANRLEWIRSTWGIDTGEYADTLDVVHLRGMTLEMAQFVNLLEEHGNDYDAILIDSLYSLNDGDENSAHDMKLIFEQLDRLCADGAAVLTTHHHAKGNAGVKSAIDRGSGSGVLGRAPDAILDMSPLAVEEGSAAWEMLRAHDYHTKDGGTVFAIGLRMTFVLREFATPAPLNLIFRCPVHELDVTGELSETRIVGSAADNGSKGGNAKHDKDVEVYRQIDEVIGDAVDALHADGEYATRENVRPRVNSWRVANGLKPWEEKTFAEHTRGSGRLSWRVMRQKPWELVPVPSEPAIGQEELELGQVTPPPE